MKRHLLLSLLLSFSSPLFAQSAQNNEILNQQLSEAMKLLTDEKTAQQGTQLLMQVAKSNHPDAQQWLGDSYFYGSSVDTPQDYAKAMYWYEKAAEQRSAFAAQKLAEIHEKGLGVPVDLVKAFQYHKKADELLGYANDSGLYVGKAYLNGIGVEKDVQQAVTYLEKNAEGYSTEANLLLGQLYEAGEGVAQSDSKAFEYYSRIGLSHLFNNNSEASFRLAKMYAEGRGTEKNLVEAVPKYLDVFHYGSRALKQEAEADLKTHLPELTKQAETDSKAQLALASLYENGIGVPKDVFKADHIYKTIYQQSDDEFERMDAFFTLDALRKKVTGVQRPVHIIEPTQEDKTALIQAQTAIDQADMAKACQMLQPLAEKGWAEAQYAFAHLQIDEFCTPSLSKTEIFELMQRAARQQHTPAMADLAWMYQNGFGTEEDWWFAAYWNQQAADKGHVNALYHLAYHYEEGIGVLRDLQKAVEFYQKAADQDHMEAQTNLGQLYANGKLGEPNYSKALELFTIAAKQGDELAMSNLGILYLEGDGVAKDVQQAIYWLDQAAEKGEPNAAMQLASLYQFGDGVKKDLKKAFEYHMIAARCRNV